MSKLTWEDLERKDIAIHTPTEDLMKLVVNTIVENEKTGDIKYGEYGHDFSLHKEDTCIRIDKFGIWSYSDVGFYVDNKYKIVEYEEVKHLFELERTVKPNQIYRHFKKGDYYATLGVSKPIDREEFEEILNCTVKRVYHTELNRNIVIVFKDNKYYHNINVSEDELVLYVPLQFSDYPIYARPKEMFLSTVDRDKYKNATQEYRMELIK